MDGHYLGKVINTDSVIYSPSDAFRTQYLGRWAKAHLSFSKFLAQCITKLAINLLCIGAPMPGQIRSGRLATNECATPTPSMT